MAGDDPGPPAVAARPPIDFDELYETNVDVVFRALARLGVPDRAIDDALQDVFVIAHRRLPDFEGRSSPRTWLYGITLRVASGYRRSNRRVLASTDDDVDPDALAGSAEDPEGVALRRERVRLLDRLLDTLDDDKRAVFVLVEIEGLAVPDVAAVLGIKLNTAYSRLRLARTAFDQALERHRARKGVT